MPEIRNGLPDFGEATVDVLVVGGGITGAGVFRRCARLGYRVFLVDKGDFASGTSSRSSNLVHGGLHYLSHGKIRLARRSCRDRNALLASSPGLVDRLRVFLPDGAFSGKPRWAVRAVLAAYERLAGRPAPGSVLELTGPSTGDGGVSLGTGLGYSDGITDDAGLVLRVIREGCQAGGYAGNYIELDAFLRDGDGAVRGGRLRDRRTGRTMDVQARAVVNAAGIWADRLRGVVGGRPRLTFLRGSHLVIPWQRVPIRRAVAGVHPGTGRPIYLIPWKGVTLVGSTSVPHAGSVDLEPRVHPSEARYLLNGARGLLPELRLTAGDISGSYSGLRAIVDGGTDPTGNASREHMIEERRGLITVTGGKLTTFPSMARSVTRRIEARMPGGPRQEKGGLVLDPVPDVPASLPVKAREAGRILARYGDRGLDRIASSPGGERRLLPGLPVSVAELRWCLVAEAVNHLDDLLLRRTRVGRTHPEATAQNLGRILGIAREELGWSQERCDGETDRLRWMLRHTFGVPDMEGLAQEERRPPTRWHVA